MLLSIILAGIICGIICTIAQMFSEMKIPFPAIAIIMTAVFGGLLTHFGVIDYLCSLGAGGVSATALGCGNGAFNAGIQLKSSGNIMPLILCVLLNVVIVFMGALAGGKLVKKEKTQQ